MQIWLQVSDLESEDISGTKVEVESRGVMLMSLSPCLTERA